MEFQSLFSFGILLEIDVTQRQQFVEYRRVRRDFDAALECVSRVRLAARQHQGGIRAAEYVARSLSSISRHYATLRW